MVSKVIKYNDALKGIIVINEKEYPVSNVIKDELIDVKLSEDEKSVTFNKVISSSKERVTPPCKYFNVCGGCHLQHVTYEEQLKIKQDTLNDLFLNTLGIKNKVLPVLGMTDPYHYRNKNQMEYRSEFKPKKHIIGGFYSESTHNVIDVDDCLIQDSVINQIMIYAKSVMMKLHYDAYNEDKHTGLIRHILVKRSEITKEIMVVVVTGQETFPGANNFAKELVKKFPDIKTVIQNVNSRNTSVVLGEKEKVIYGSGFIYDILMGIKFKVSAKSFYQVNSKQCEVLYSKAIELAELKKNEVLLDAYCGVGTIGIISSKYVKKVIGVELNKDAVKDAFINVRNNKITNAEFFEGDASIFIRHLAKDNAHIDCIIMDPPRSGSTKEFIKSVLKLRPKKVVYISCNPYTQVNDLKYFLDDYKITAIQPVDMFPNTYHVENIVSMQLISK